MVYVLQGSLKILAWIILVLSWLATFFLLYVAWINATRPARGIMDDLTRQMIGGWTTAGWIILALLICSWGTLVWAFLVSMGYIIEGVWDVREEIILRLPKSLL